MSRANDQWSHSPSKLEGKLPQRLLTRLSQVWGHREGGEKDVEDELRLASAATPSSTLKAYSVPPREERAHSSAFDELYTTTHLPFPTLVSHTSFPISQEKWKRTSCLWGLLLHWPRLRHNVISQMQARGWKKAGLSWALWYCCEVINITDAWGSFTYLC